MHASRPLEVGVSTPTIVIINMCFTTTWGGSECAHYLFMYVVVVSLDYKKVLEYDPSHVGARQALVVRECNSSYYFIDNIDRACLGDHTL